jgi:hypothetical protein
LKRKIKQVVAQKKKTMVLRIIRGIHTMYLEFEPNWDAHKAAMKGNL